MDSQEVEETRKYSFIKVYYDLNWERRSLAWKLLREEYKGEK